MITIKKPRKVPRHEGVFDCGMALTFQDVRLRTNYTETIPSEANLETRFSINVGLKIPLVSSPMDTITEHQMAIAMAKAGGLGIIHRNLTVDQQVEQVLRVKQHLNGLVAKPTRVLANHTMQQVMNMVERLKLTFHTFPVVDVDNKLVGLLTKDDFILCDNMRCKVQDAMQQNIFSAPDGINRSKAYKLMKEHRQKVLPLISNNGQLTSMYVFSDLKRMRMSNHNGFNLDNKGHLRVGAAITTGNQEIERAQQLATAGADVLVIDASVGDTKNMYSAIKELKHALRQFSTDIVAGNVSNGESAWRYYKAGVHGMRIGQGPGAICDTRLVVGIGRPQVTAVYDCAEAVKSSGIPICADGGIAYSGDISVAISAGADCVMVGNLIAGTDETPGRVIILKGIPHKVYRGMGSLEAMRDNQASRERYKQSHSGKATLVPEGVTGAVPCKGRVSEQIEMHIEGIRRAMGATGCKNIKELKTKSSLERHSPAGQRESHPSVNIIEDAPNYRPPQS